MTMRRFAEHIIAVSNEAGIDITNLQLQKVMFFALGMHLRQANEIDQLALQIYNEPFNKWRYGPVVESMYYRYNHFGKNPIIDNEAQQHEEYAHLNNIIENLLVQDVFKLVRISHQMSAWRQYENDIINNNFVNPYELSEILEDFRDDG